MSKITPKQICDIVKKTLKSNIDFTLSYHVWKTSIKDMFELCMEIREDHMECYVLIMDYNFQILNVIDSFEEKIIDELTISLIGKTLDTSFLECPYLLATNPNLYSSQSVLGYIKNNRVESLSKENFLDIPKNLHNLKQVNLFKEIVTKYDDLVSFFGINYDTYETWSVAFDHPLAAFGLTISDSKDSFVSLKIYPKNDLESGIRLSYENFTEQEIKSVLNDIFSDNLSLFTKSLIVLDASLCCNSNKYVITQQGSDKVLVDIKYSSKQIRGTYSFDLDFKKKKVTCLDARKSTSFIPREIESLEKQIKAL